MKKLLKFIFPVILVSVTIFLCLKNYSPGTYLIGWDSLHPEFNFPEAFGRIWQGVWRAEQGVGAIAAHSHIADWPRLVFLWLESFILPASFLRYSYIFLCLILGPLGMYLFLEYVFRRQKESRWIYPHNQKLGVGVYPAAFLGALFYLLNLGTLQNFYVPFEMFPAAFAATPWLFYLGLKCLREMTRGALVKFAVVVVLASPMAYAATLWYATFAGLFIFFIGYAMLFSARKTKIKRVFLLAGTALLLNLYWILPNFYSMVMQSGTVSNSDINRLFSPESFLRNRDYGDFKDIALQKNFLFGWRNFDFQNNQFTNLLSVWIKYLTIPAVLAVGYVMIGISLFGLLLGVIKREKVSLALILPLIFTLFFLINANPPTGNLYAYLYNNFGLFSEGFRMPFTKFSVLFEFITSFYLGYFAFVFLTNRIKFLAVIKPFFFVGVVTGLIYFMLPAFNGWLIGPNVRRQIPGEYKQVSDWFNSNLEGRIAIFPINSKYGWEYRNWGYEGSGFLTYGISSPVLYRDFDRWNSGNEDFFNQAAFSLYANDKDGFVNTLRKYQVRYLLIDESIINPGGTSEILMISELKNILAESGVKEVANFGFLTIYDVGTISETGYGREVSNPQKFIQTDYDSSYTPMDPVYAGYGDYVNAGSAFPARKKVSLPVGDPVITEDLSINRGFTSTYNCDLRKEGNVFKSNSSLGILLRAEDGGASCDYLPYPDLKYAQAYVLRVAGQNREGRGLKVYLFNESSQVPELEEILPSGNFDENYFVYPHNQNVGAGVYPESGYILNFETRSFGRLASENLVTKVEFYPVDSNYLQNFQDGLLTSNENNLKILNVQKYGTWAYKVDVQGSGLIQLGQGYDSGWVAIQARDFPSDIFHLPFLEHVKVNSWANGWIVPANQPINQSTIYLIYWPQLLEWGGGLLGLTWLAFGLYYICIRK